MWPTSLPFWVGDEEISELGDPTVSGFRSTGRKRETGVVSRVAATLFYVRFNDKGTGAAAAVVVLGGSPPSHEAASPKMKLLPPSLHEFCQDVCSFEQATNRLLSTV